MKFTGLAGRLPEEEQVKILYFACKHGVQATMLAAIRLTENGGPGREFGVLSEDAKTYDKQCDMAARSIRNNLFRFVVHNTGTWPTDNDRYSNAFLEFMQKRWAPRGVANDPDDLNKNWYANILRFYSESSLSES